jgi:hypothetical protein
VQQALDLMRLADKAPASPVNAILPANRRRVLRRDAKRLRQGKTEPRYKNLYTEEELADLYERTVQRDELLERYLEDFNRIGRELDRIREEHPAAFQTAMETFRPRGEAVGGGAGPRSEAARRFRHVQGVAWLAHQQHSQRRRQKTPVSPRINLADPSVEARNAQTAAEFLTSPPSADDAVIAIPPEGKDSGEDAFLCASDSARHRGSEASSAVTRSSARSACCPTTSTCS